MERILVPGWNVASSERALACVDRYAGLDAAVGIHPHDAAKVDDAGWDRIVGWAPDPRVVAIGETGLDYDRVFSPIADQLTNLRRNLALALDTGKPAILHCRSSAGRRDAQDALVAELRAAGVGGPAWAAAFGDRPPAVIHSFSGPADYAARGRRPGSGDQLLRARLSGGGGGLGDGRRDRAGGPRARRDRFAIPRPAGSTTLAQRPRVGPRHGRVAGGSPRVDTAGPRAGPRRRL